MQPFKGLSNVTFLFSEWQVRVYLIDHSKPAEF